MRAGYALFILATLAAGPASANSSTYTKLDLDHCKKLSSSEAGALLKCAGYRSYPVYFAEDDLRESLRYGPAAKDLIEKSFESFAQFNNINMTIEWRLDDVGKPIAAIQRWFTDNPDPSTGAASPKNAGQVLVVSRVAQENDGLSCVVGYVDALANPTANDLARKLADDNAADFACGYTEPMWVGTKGPKAGTPSNNLPDRLKAE
ncbi:hypothetical protein [Rhizobium sp. C4]|uniref:hypothetical protein n=1 Tax=Rhizobium sp. C4 TaxID=1349800 RepID=UPI001E455221|nr:hypothetical protein [Rhizobium sp. C4]MCD2175492.1 hypothetical protein [Rhizobium sp. C4]